MFISTRYITLPEWLWKLLGFVALKILRLPSIIFGETTDSKSCQITNDEFNQSHPGKNDIVYEIIFQQNITFANSDQFPMQHGSILENLSIRLVNNTEYVWTQTQGTNSQCLSVPSLFHSLLVSTLEEFNQ